MHTTEHHYLGAEEGFAGARAASPSRAHGRFRELVVRAARPARHPLGRQRRRHAQRLPRALRRRRPLHDAFRAGGGQGGAQLRIMTAQTRGSCRIIANVFDGGPRTAVTFEIPGVTAPAAPMAAAARPRSLPASGACARGCHSQAMGPARRVPRTCGTPDVEACAAWRASRHGSGARGIRARARCPRRAGCGCLRLSAARQKSGRCLRMRHEILRNSTGLTPCGGGGATSRGASSPEIHPTGR